MDVDDAKAVARIVRDVKRATGAVTMTSATLYDALVGHALCMSSSSDFASPNATSTSGLFDAPGRVRVRVHSVHVRGSVWVNPTTTTPGRVGSVRRITVWFNKPKQAAASTGGLPGSFEALDLIAGESGMFHSDNENAGRFVVLDDRTDYLGNLFVPASGAHAFAVGPCRVDFDDHIKVDRDVLFAAPCTEAAPGGHYDSDVDAGRVSRGLIMQYWFVDDGTSFGTDTVSVRAQRRVFYS